MTSKRFKWGEGCILIIEECWADERDRRCPASQGTAHGGSDKDSALLFDQLRAIDTKRLIGGPLLQLDSESLLRVFRAVTEVLGMEIAP